jgi:hypothetical protein
MHKAGTCIHFNGIQNKTCDAGIAYDSLNFPDGKTHTRILPCLQRLANEASQRTRKPIAECPQRLEPTAQQIAESAAEVKAAIARDLKIVPLVNSLKIQHKGKGYRGLHDCPGCGGKQTLHISLASSNNHSRGQCETAGCVAWIE